MTSYYFSVLRCTKCAAEFSVMNVASCNTIGAKFFTDGCVEGPMYDDGAAVLCCPGCSAYHWLDELTVIRDLDESEYFAGLESDRLPIASRLEGDLYDDALRQGAWSTPEQVAICRLHAMPSLESHGQRPDGPRAMP